MIMFNNVIRTHLFSYDGKSNRCFFFWSDRMKVKEVDLLLFFQMIEMEYSFVCIRTCISYLLCVPKLAKLDMCSFYQFYLPGI